MIRNDWLILSLTHWCCSAVTANPGCHLGWLHAAKEPAQGRDYHPLPGGSGTALTPWWTGTHLATGKEK